LRRTVWIAGWVLMASAFRLCVMVQAGAPDRAVREAAELALRRLGPEVGQEAAEALTRRAERLAAQHGTEVLDALHQAGPEALTRIEARGGRGELAARLLAQHGPAVIPIVRRPALLDLVARHGEEIIAALVRHPALAEPVIAAAGPGAARALARVGSQNARRLAMMAEDGTLTRLGRTEEVLAVVEKYGDRALDFLWRHKGALAVGTVLAAFLRDPEPFLSGAKDLGRVATGAVTTPLVHAAQQVGAGWAQPIAVAAGLGIGVVAGAVLGRLTRIGTRRKP
jgi:hypothetical protein